MISGFVLISIAILIQPVLEVVIVRVMMRSFPPPEMQQQLAILQGRIKSYDVSIEEINRIKAKLEIQLPQFKKDRVN